MRILVTGGAGFIGSHIVEKLVKENHEVRVLDNLSTGNKENLKGVMDKIEFIEGDIRDKKMCLKATEGRQVVSHQAALKSVPKSFANVNEFNTVNINGTVNLLEASVKNGANKFIFASSSSVYGGYCQQNGQTETDELYPKSPYAVTKMVGEHYCAIFSKEYKLSTICLRYFNVFGERQPIDDNYSAVIPKFIDCALKQKPYPIYGDGTQSRDFTYVGDVAMANVLSLCCNYGSAITLNIAYGKAITITKLAEHIHCTTNPTSKERSITYFPPRVGDIQRSQANITQARNLLLYYPEFDAIHGLRKTIEYFRNKK